MDSALKAIRAFGLPSDTIITPYGDGLINTTFLVTTMTSKYILQEINTKVFPDVVSLCKNNLIVSNHLKKYSRYTVIKYVERIPGICFVEVSGKYFRMSEFIESSSSPIDLHSIELTGEAFAEYEEILSTLSEALYNVIPHFHDLRVRLSQLDESVSVNYQNRLLKVTQELEIIHSFRDEMMSLQEMKDSGALPIRVAHCDTKCNNVLFDNNGRVKAIIDLDTTQNEAILSDYGDFLRVAANTGKEDDMNLENVNFNFDVFKSFTKGYLTHSQWLTQIEKETLAPAVLFFPYMQAVRFLADYLNGDTYYHIDYASHNLVRTKAQLKLFLSARKVYPAIQATIAQYS
ncbi:hypothetical protein EIN_152470 [Entamoeba invadens IP1]|uniref:Aminoglycoside phosphotransferase domain-containing protein n=1 Tax=Entamoeba invadens IP1 TaxID=370355 RepID=A0A0A1U8L4_ENTIV|nr:hypothetical protein EIN_152470 [Entamoeba invadens IP1]ELP91270.1 hypothetical protein EIN_152470 [Entamoeba invadens IP1]|eukprot:XP_004258041.1 hypothetical protein EIN_152470 [Entamoeba invadens IP1]